MICCLPSAVPGQRLGYCYRAERRRPTELYLSPGASDAQDNKRGGAVASKVYGVDSRTEATRRAQTHLPLLPFITTSTGPEMRRPLKPDNRLYFAIGDAEARDDIWQEAPKQAFKTHLAATHEPAT